MTAETFVPPDFAVPDGLVTNDFRLEPLGPEHNEADHAAWTSSMDHIAATPGFQDGGWPHEMSADDNRRDLERHARDFAERRGFTYTVLSHDADDVIGCVYIYPQRNQGPDRVLLSEGHAEVRPGCASKRSIELAARHPSGEDAEAMTRREYDELRGEP